MAQPNRNVCAMKTLVVSIAAAAALACGAFARADSTNDESKIRQGYAISPVQLNLDGKNRALVGLGSYLVNSSGCNDCHTHPSYVAGHNPFLGQSELVNAAQFMSGGRMFGPVIVSANLTPDANGRPAGLTLEQFKQTLRTGHNPLDPPGVLLQVMPWPPFGKKTDGDLEAIYEYLSAIPSLPDPTPGP